MTGKRRTGPVARLGHATRSGKPHGKEVENGSPLLDVGDDEGESGPTRRAQTRAARCEERPSRGPAGRRRNIGGEFLSYFHARERMRGVRETDAWLIRMAALIKSKMLK